MAGNKSKRERRLVRRKAFKNPKKRILIVTEGEVTEPEYLKGLTPHFPDDFLRFGT